MSTMIMFPTRRHHPQWLCVGPRRLLLSAVLAVMAASLLLQEASAFIQHATRPITGSSIFLSSIPSTSRLALKPHSNAFAAIDQYIIRGNLPLRNRPHCSSSGTRTISRLFAASAKNKDDDDASLPVPAPTDPLLLETSKVLRRASWFSWWSQVILTTISSVILLFAKSTAVQRVSTPPPSFVLSGAGILLSAVSIVWTWGNGTRLSRRLIIPNKPTSRYKAAIMLRRAIRVGATLNMFGLLCTLLAAQEIVGTLAIKVLTANRSNVFSAGAMAVLPPEGLQPLDVLVVQANTNSLLSQFCSLASLLYMTKEVGKLDPPSTDDHIRGRRTY